MQPRPVATRRQLIGQVLLWFAVTTAGVALLLRIAAPVPLLRDNVGALVALVFLYVPAWVARRRGQDLSDHGFRVAPLRRGLVLGLGVLALVLPCFAVGFAGFYEIACQADALRGLTPPGFCARFRGITAPAAPELDWGFAELALVQLIVVALPEELFFRGFLHRLLEEALPPRRRPGGGGLGLALLVSSALFALSHLVADLDPRRLSVFFPGLLFGWLYSATGSLLAGTLAHAGSNLFMDLLYRIYFG